MGSKYESTVEATTAGILNIVLNSSTEDLKALLQNESRIDSLIMDSAQVRALEAEKEALLRANKSLAQWNLAQEPRLRDAKRALLETYDSAASLRSSVVEAAAALEAAGESRSLDTTQALLEAAARESEERSEGLAEKMLAGELEVDEFVRSFLSERGQAHARRIKADRMGEVLRGQAYGDPTAPAPPRRRPPPPPSALHSNYTL